MNKSTLNYINIKFNQLEKRERIVIFVAFIICFLSVTYFWIVDPALIKQSKTTEHSQKILKENKQILAKIARIKVKLRSDPEKEMQAKIAALENQQKQVEGDLKNKKTKFINEMPAALTKILDKDQNVKIISIRSLPIEKSSEVINTELEARKVLFYKHTLELKLTGDYNAIYQYVLKLEELTLLFYWYSFNYQVTDYPNANVVVRIFTISEHRNLVND